MKNQGNNQYPNSDKNILPMTPKNSGIITGYVLGINDAPRSEDQVEWYGEIEIIGNRVKLIDDINSYPNIVQAEQRAIPKLI